MFQFSHMFKMCGLKTLFFEVLQAKPCRIIWKLPQQINFECETCETEPKVLQKLHGNCTGTYVPFLIHFTKNIVFCLQTRFCGSFNVLLSFLEEKWYRTNIKLPQKGQFWTRNMRNRTKSRNLGYPADRVFPEDSPLFYRASKQPYKKNTCEYLMQKGFVFLVRSLCPDCDDLLNVSRFRSPWFKMM